MANNGDKKSFAKKLANQTRKLLEEKGRESLETAKKVVLDENVECTEIHEALQYFMNQYWHDLTTPTLLSLSCEAVGGNAEDVRPIAVPLILISGAIDIHDDIVDKSKTKDGRKTVVGKFGQEVALIVGDFLLGKGFLLINKTCKRINNRKFPLITETIETALSELADAEFLEIFLQRKKIIEPFEYLHVVRKKASDIEGLMKVGALIGGGSENEIQALGKYGRCLGMLSILRDDLIDLIDPREIRHRIKYECLPLPLLYALENAAINSFATFAFIRKAKSINSILEFVKENSGFKNCDKVMHNIAKGCYSTANTLKYQSANFSLLVDFMLSTTRICNG